MRHPLRAVVAEPADDRQNVLALDRVAHPVVRAHPHPMFGQNVLKRGGRVGVVRQQALWSLEGVGGLSRSCAIPAEWSQPVRQTRVITVSLWCHRHADTTASWAQPSREGGHVGSPVARRVRRGNGHVARKHSHRDEPGSVRVARWGRIASQKGMSRMEQPPNVRAVE